MPKQMLTVESLDVPRMIARADANTAQRGRAYFMQGRARVKRVGSSDADATVQGSHLYHVTFLLGDRGIVSACTCPLSNGDPDVMCKHQIAAALALRNYLVHNPPVTWETVLAQAIKPPVRSGPLTRLILFFSLQSRSGTRGAYPYALPASAFPDEALLDPEALAQVVKQEKLSAQAKPVRTLGDARRFVQTFGGDRALLTALLGASENSYSYYYERSVEVKALLPLLAGGAVFQGTENNPLQSLLRVASEAGQPRLEMREAPGRLELHGAVTLGDQTFPLVPEKTQILLSDPLWLLSGKTIFPIEDSGEVVKTLLENPELTIPADETETFLDKYLLPLAERVPVTGNGVAWEELSEAAPVPRLYLSEDQGQMAVRLRFGYGEFDVPYAKPPPETSLLRKPDTLTLVRVARQPTLEQERWDSVSHYGLKRGAEPDQFALRARTDVVDFLLKQVPKLTEAGFEIYGERELASARVNRSRPKISFQVSSGIDWFDVEAIVEFGDTHVSLKAIRRAVRSKERYLKLADGSIGEIPEEWLEKYRYLFAMADESGDGLRLAGHQLTLLDQLLNEGDRVQADAEFQRRLQHLRDFSQITPRPLPSGLTGELRPYQKAGYDWLHFLHEYGFGGCLADDMGTGKAQPLDAKILTPTGWKPMGEMQVGDWVINAQGGTSTVTGVFPQGDKEIFRVTLSDGSQTECCDDHLWAVNSAVRKKRGNAFQTLPLSVIRERLRDGAGNCRHFLPIVKPIEFDEQLLPLHPYLLGALLGDGGLTRSVIFSPADAEMIVRLKSLLPQLTKMTSKGRYDWQISKIAGEKKNAVLDALRQLGLAGHRTEGKFIPDLYKFSSVESRIALLQGLLDTDGFIDTRCKDIEFLSVSLRLANDVVFLVQSLGGTASIRPKKTSGQLAYRLHIVLPPGIAPFALSRKANACLPRTKYHPTRAIVSVEPVGVKPAQCIAVNSPDHLYVTDQCIVTHNTFTTLAFLLSLSQSHEAKAATLLVLPRSLIFNWERESAKFTSGLRLLNHAHATRAKDLTQFDEYDLVLTTYGIMLRDIEMLKQHRFHYVVLDEAQAIKNPLSQSAKAARLLTSDHRLTLTGTPVENSTLELWSQFSFLNPGLLGSLETFREEFAGPIERHQDEAAAKFLRRMVHPFILRRTKDQVATELPPRTERIVYTEMESAQRKLYEKMRDQYRAQILGILDKEGEQEGMNDARMKILEGLLRLRQICNHPKLVEPITKAASGKFETLMETLETLRAEGHKALVFSQFVQMLKIIQEALDTRHIPYSYLDGSTKDRQGRVDTFQNDPAIPFFLISLKAGGVGLNLTAADYVIHVDPWWNPAVEMQATDRTHRIGQDKPVFVYKLIARDSVEEKILQLQDRKRALVSQLIGTETGLFKSLTRSDIEALFT